MKTETFDSAAAFLTALHGQKRGRGTRPGIPAAGRAAPTGLTSLIAPKAGSSRPAWSLAFEVGRGYRMYVIGSPVLDTGWCESELEACQKAKAFV